MKVYLRDIPYDGLFLRQTVSAKELELTGENFVCLSPLEIEANFEKAQDSLLVGVVVQGKYELSCARCLEPVKQSREDEFDLVFDITPETEFIECFDDIRQEMLIVLAGVVRCREDCKGLCVTCGVNLNKASCACPHPEQEGWIKI